MALLIIDFQNEYFSVNGYLGSNCLDGIYLASKVKYAIMNARKLNYKIIWITSNYDGKELEPIRANNTKDNFVPMNDDKLASTYIGNKKCCEKGSIYEDIFPMLKSMQEETDIFIRKNRYSAFTDTILKETLDLNIIKNLIITGVLTNESVQATVCDGYFSGYNIIVLEDCVLTNDDKKQKKSIETIKTYYGKIMNLNDYLHSENIFEIIESKYKKYDALKDIGSGDSMLIYNVIPKEYLDKYEDFFEVLRKENVWSEMFHKGGPVPRLISLQGDIEEKDDKKIYPLYRHPVDKQPKFSKWSNVSNELKDIVSKIMNQKINHALIQYYRDGTDWISEHSDKTLDMEIGLPVLNLSFGATRTLILKHKENKLSQQKIRLPNNSLFVLGWKTNREWLHSIKQDKRPNIIKTPDELSFSGERISYTFRTISTYLTSDGFIFGQGAKNKTFVDTKTELLNSEQSVLLKAFSEENNKSSFDWEKNYSCGFDIINFEC